MTFYLTKLENEKKVSLFVQELKSEYPYLKFDYLPGAAWYATLVVRNSNDEYISEYQLSNYNVVKCNYHFSGKNRFGEIILTDTIRKIYVRFMKKTFPEYREDYLKACKNTALDNLGELNNEM